MAKYSHHAFCKWQLAAKIVFEIPFCNVQKMILRNPIHDKLSCLQSNQGAIERKKEQDHLNEDHRRRSIAASSTMGNQRCEK